MDGDVHGPACEAEEEKASHTIPIPAIHPTATTLLEPEQRHCYQPTLTTTTSFPLELVVQNLSLSLLPKPSLVSSLARSIQTNYRRLISRSSFDRHPTPSSHIPADEEGNVARVSLDIFRNVSLNLKSGQVCLILGGCASGKTTLLNTLAGQTKIEDVALSGRITYNGHHPADSFWHTTKIGYFGRQDNFNARLTPRETLEFVANLHHGTLSTSCTMQAQIEQLLHELGLQDSADRWIGTSDTVGGLRASELRRISLAVQLITSPSVLFCQEPTHGLDALESYQLMKTLKDVARSRQMIIVATMQEPQSDIFPLLLDTTDASQEAQILLLSRGDMMYSGPIANALQWFESVGTVESCPGNINPFEYFVDLSVIDFSSYEKEMATRTRRRRLIHAWATRSKAWHKEKQQQQNQERQQGEDEPDARLSIEMMESSRSEQIAPTAAGPPWTAHTNPKNSIAKRMNPVTLARSFWKQVAKICCHTIVLTRRGLLCHRRNLRRTVGFLLLNIVLSAWLGYIFSSLSGKALDIQSRFAVMFTLVTFQPLIYLLFSMEQGAKEVRVFDRERACRRYGPLPYVVSSVLKDLPVALITVICFATIIYFAGHLRTDSFIYYFYNILTLCCLQVFICIMALFFCSIFRGFLSTTLICITFYSDYFISAGFFITADRIPKHYTQMAKVSPFALAYRILSSVEFTNRSFECPFEPNGSPSDPFRCHQYDGNNILHHKGHVAPYYYPEPIAYLLIHCAILLVLTWVVLTFRVVAPTAPANPGNFIDLIIQLTSGIFVGFKPQGKPSLYSQNPNLARSSATVDQLRYILASAANNVTSPNRLMPYGEVRDGHGGMSFSSSSPSTAAGIGAAAGARGVDTTEMPMATTKTTVQGPSCPPSSFPVTLMSDQFMIEAAAAASDDSEAFNDVAGEHDDDDYEDCRVDMAWMNQGLSRPRDLIEIRINQLGLYATVPTRWEANVGGSRWTKPLMRRKERKRILHDVSVTFPPGQLTSIVGGRGTGKTALLEVILNRLSSSSSWCGSKSTLLTIHGDVYFNASRNPCLAKIDAVCGYVCKDNNKSSNDSLLLTHLTVRETLRFAAELGVRSRSKKFQPSKAELWNKVEAIMDLVGLVECADELVGSKDVPHCSDSQRRRLAIALQLINEPTCLVLDEPTTGLDAVAALEIVRLLKTIARTGRTVICTLHQPSSAAWNELDNVVLLMHNGRLGYAGKTSRILHFFAAAHLVLPANTNPADFVVEKTSINRQSVQDEVETRQRTEQLALFFTEYRAHMPSLYYCEDDDANQNNLNECDHGHHITSLPRARTSKKLRRRTPRYASFVQATPILARRSFVNTWRQKGPFFNRILAPLMAALMADLYFTHVDRSPAGMMERFSFIQIQVLMSWYGAFVAENRYSIEKLTAYHEISNGAYGASSFLLAYTVNEIPVTCLASGLTVFFAYVSVPFQWSLTSLCFLFGSTSVLIMAGESLRMLFDVWISQSSGVSFGATLITITAINQMAGLYKHRLPLWVIKVNYLNLWKYTTEGLARVIYPSVNKVFCTPEQELELRCLIRDGESWMAFLRLNRHSLVESAFAMLALTLFYRILVWVSLLIKTSRQR